jgi:hypothetical protein
MKAQTSDAFVALVDPAIILESLWVVSQRSSRSSKNTGGKFTRSNNSFLQSELP